MTNYLYHKKTLINLFSSAIAVHADGRCVTCENAQCARNKYDCIFGDINCSEGARAKWLEENYEKYQEEIITAFITYMGIDAATLKIMECGDLLCANCLCKQKNAALYGCQQILKEWLLSEA